MTVTLTGAGRYPDHSSPRASSQAISNSIKFWVSGSDMKSIKAMTFIVVDAQMPLWHTEEERGSLREQDESAMSAGRKPTTDKNMSFFIKRRLNMNMSDSQLFLEVSCMLMLQLSQARGLCKETTSSAACPFSLRSKLPGETEMPVGMGTPTPSTSQMTTSPRSKLPAMGNMWWLEGCGRLVSNNVLSFDPFLVDLADHIILKISSLDLLF